MMVQGPALPRHSAFSRCRAGLWSAVWIGDPFFFLDILKGTLVGFSVKMKRVTDFWLLRGPVSPFGIHPGVFKAWKRK
jgi:hypothetical protein